MKRILSGLLLGALVGVSTAYAVNPYRGLWVGQARLGYVTEVSVPLDENNVAVAPDPKVPTPTADQAQIRLIVHVNASGQVNLLKDVAILKRSGSSTTNGYYASEADLALVTDERLYGDFPSQEAKRIASAVFDFGDIQATRAVDAIVQVASSNAAVAVKGNLDESTATVRVKDAVTPLLAPSDVAASFDRFLKDHLDQTTVDGFADAPAGIDGLRPTAEALVKASFYGDSRPVKVLDALAAAIAAASTPEEKHAAAQNAVARYADVNNAYGRFIRGTVFGDMIQSVSSVAAEAAIAGDSRSAMDAAARNTPEFLQAQTDAALAKVAAYADTAAPMAVETVISNMVDTAFAASTNSVVDPGLASTLEQRGLEILDTLQRVVISPDIPSTDYTDFIRSAEFLQAADTVAAAAVKAARFETTQDPFYTVESLEGKARIAAVQALHGLYASAARAHRTELPLEGAFALGSGDARLRFAISDQDAPLGPAGLRGTIVLPANHPTNPFRHRRHPSHTVGFDISRELRFDFDGASTNALEKTGLGVDRITGIYREEIHGLHKPLGPDPVNHPIGLRVEGPFELNRISLIDTLNAR